MRARHLYRPLIAHQVLVVTDTGESFTGTVLRALGDLLVLARASLLTERNPPRPLDGEVVIDRARITFIQVQGATWR